LLTLYEKRRDDRGEMRKQREEKREETGGWERREETGEKSDERGSSTLCLEEF
jgi:hypothetical protein